MNATEIKQKIDNEYNEKLTSFETKIKDLNEQVCKLKKSYDKTIEKIPVVENSLSVLGLEIDSIKWDYFSVSLDIKAVATKENGFEFIPHEGYCNEGHLINYAKLETKANEINEKLTTDVVGALIIVNAFSLEKGRLARYAEIQMYLSHF